MKTPDTIQNAITSQAILGMMKPTQGRPSRANSLADEEFLAADLYLKRAGVTAPDKELAAWSKGELLNYRNGLRRAQTALSEETERELKKGPDAYDDAKAQANIKTVESISAIIRSVQDRLDLNDKFGSGHASAASDDWRNGSGDTIKVLDKTQRLADLHGERAGFGFGEYVKAMVAGTSNPIIRNALSEGTDSAGGYTVPDALLREVIDNMRAKSAAISAGGMTIPLETNLNTIVRVASDPVAGWRLENGAIAESDATFDGVVLQPRSLAVLVKVSRELLDDSINLEQAMMQAFAGSSAAELDRVAFVGSGTVPEPRGIFNQSGINVVSMGTNGAAITDYTALLDALYELQLDNANDPSAMVMHPRTMRVLNGFVDTTGQPLLPPPALSGVMRLATTNVPIDQTQGTASNASCIFVGDFSQLILGVRESLRIQILRERFADSGQYAFVMHLRADIALAQPKAFCVVKGIIPA